MPARRVSSSRIYEPGTICALRFDGQIQAIGRRAASAGADAAGDAVAERSWAGGRARSPRRHAEILHIGPRTAQPDSVYRIRSSRSSMAAPHSPRRSSVDVDIVNALGALVPLGAAAPAAQSRADRVHRRGGAAHSRRSPASTRRSIAASRRSRRPSPCRATFRRRVRRYGFHGLSYEFVAVAPAPRSRPADDARVVIAHLGNGASLCAVRAGRSVASTMGFTAVDGLMMGTRCGHDRSRGTALSDGGTRMDARRSRICSIAASGLLGVSGISSDMRTLRNPPTRGGRGNRAVRLSHRARDRLLAAALGGLDALVFTAGLARTTRRRARP